MSPGALPTNHEGPTGRRPLITASTPLGRLSERSDLRERFEAKFTCEPNTGCWLWTASVRADGRGQFNTSGSKPELAHRVAFRLYRGAIPDGKLVCHSCDNGDIGCVNPQHLFLSTHQGNVADRHAKGRTRQGHVPLRSGEYHGRSKLTWAGADEIRALYAAGGIGALKLGRRFGVSKRAVQFIVQGKHWPEHRRPAAPAAPGT